MLAYGHDEGCSVTGGFVYRGGAIPEIAGHYFYGDWCARWVRSFFYDGSTVTDERDWTAEFGDLGQIVSFGLDGDGELLIVTQEGPIYRVVPVR